MKDNLSENEQKVLDYLNNHDHLTIRQAFIILDINNPYDILMRLRNFGYNIPMAWKTTENNKRYGIYKLIQ